MVETMNDAVMEYDKENLAFHPGDENICHIVVGFPSMTAASEWYYRFARPLLVKHYLWNYNPVVQRGSDDAEIKYYT